jgi:hypothetical protein
MGRASDTVASNSPRRSIFQLIASRWTDASNTWHLFQATASIRVHYQQFADGPQDGYAIYRRKMFWRSLLGYKNTLCQEKKLKSKLVLADYINKHKNTNVNYRHKNIQHRYTGCFTISLQNKREWCAWLFCVNYVVTAFARSSLVSELV